MTTLGKLNSKLGFEEGVRETTTWLHQATAALRLRTIGPTNLALPQGGVFDYFYEIWKLIEMATADILFVDPYLDADFVSRYLTLVGANVVVRC
jgi:hypothetical protein